MRVSEYILFTLIDMYYGTRDVLILACFICCLFNMLTHTRRHTYIHIRIYTLFLNKLIHSYTYTHTYIYLTTNQSSNEIMVRYFIHADIFNLCKSALNKVK